MSQQLSLEAIKQKTMELLGTTNPDDVFYITEEYISGDFKELPESSATTSQEKSNLTWFGHSMYYGYREGFGDVYYFLSGSDPRDPSSVCGHYGYWAAFSHWNHYPTPKKCGVAEFQRILSFVNKFQ